MENISTLKRKRNEARTSAANARKKADRMIADCALSGQGKRMQLYQKAKALDTIADLYDDKLKQIRSNLVKASSLIGQVKLNVHGSEKANRLKTEIKLTRAANILDQLLQKC